MELAIDVEQEIDGRWIAEVCNIASVLVYGDTRDEAIERAKALASEVMRDWHNGTFFSNPCSSV